MKKMSTVIYLNEPRNIQFKEEAVTGCNDGDVLCETLVSVISPGTEVSAYIGMKPLRKGVNYPRLQGYCNVAKVVEIGSSVSNYSVGDRVLTFQSHRSHFLINENKILYKLTSTDESEKIACSYLYHLGYNAVLRSNIRAGSRVLVVGLGVLGLTSVAMSSLAGATVVGLSNYEKPRKIAREFGACLSIDRNSINEIKSVFSEGLADVIIVTTNSWVDWKIALEMSASFGVIACLGFPGRDSSPDDFNPLDSEYFYMKQLRIGSVGFSPEVNDSRGFLRFNEKDNIQYIVNLINKQSLNPEKLISNIYNFSEIELAYENLIDRKKSPITHLLTWKK